MMVMADGYGADARLVALMQYVRVLMVALRSFPYCPFLGSRTGGCGRSACGLVCPDPRTAFSRNAGPRSWSGHSQGLFPAFRQRILLIPMFLGAVLQSNGLVEIELPSWLLAVSYLLLGWTIGLRFTREILVYAIRALPKMIVSILMLIAFCGGLAFALVEVFDIDPLTAYLATSPGGADSVAIIAHPPMSIARAGQTRLPLLRHLPMSMSGLLWRSRSLVLCSFRPLVRLCPDSLRIK